MASGSGAAVTVQSSKASEVQVVGGISLPSPNDMDTQSHCLLATCAIGMQRVRDSRNIYSNCDFKALSQIDWYDYLHMHTLIREVWHVATLGSPHLIITITNNTNIQDSPVKK